MRVLIIDDHPIIHIVLTTIVREAFRDAEVDVAETLKSAIQKLALDGSTDLVLVDLHLPDCRGIDSLNKLRESVKPPPPLVVISADNSSSTIRSAIQAGAVGFLPKALQPRVMSEALKFIAGGGVYVPPDALSDDTGRRVADPQRHIRLTERQLDVVRLVVRGYTNRKIAVKLGIAEGTVKQHVHAVFRTLGASTRTEVLVMLMEAGIDVQLAGQE